MNALETLMAGEREAIVDMVREARKGALLEAIYKLERLNPPIPRRVIIILRQMINDGSVSAAGEPGNRQQDTAKIEADRNEAEDVGLLERDDREHDRADHRQQQDQSDR